MSRTYRTISPLPVRVRPFWKLSPQDRTARGLCPYCGVADHAGDHLIFGCTPAGRR